MNAEEISSSIITASPQQAGQLVDVVVRAFISDPPSRWVFPDEQQYLQYFPQFVRALGGNAFTQGAALATADYSGAALWLAPDAAPDEEALGKLIEDGVAAEKQAEMAAIVEQMGGCHPDEPHWYLPFIGVTPARQGRGYGAALLRAQLSICDKAQLPAYLESTSPKSQPLYERHGFRAIAEIKVGSCPPIVPMLRRPLMSTIGTKRTSRPNSLMSAIGGKADIQPACRDWGPHAVVGFGHSPTGLP